MFTSTVNNNLNCLVKHFVYNHDMKEKKVYDESTMQGRLDLLMEMKGLNKSDLAKIAGVKPQAVTGWYNRGEVGKSSAMKIANSTNVSVDWILEGGPEIHQLNTHRGNRLSKWFDGKEFPKAEEDVFKRLISGDLAFTDKTARRIERDYDMPSFYLDTGLATQSTAKTSEQDKELLYYFHKLTNESREDFLKQIKEKAEFYDRMFDELSKLRKIT